MKSPCWSISRVNSTWFACSDPPKVAETCWNPILYCSHMLLLQSYYSPAIKHGNDMQWQFHHRCFSHSKYLGLHFFHWFSSLPRLPEGKSIKNHHSNPFNLLFDGISIRSPSKHDAIPRRNPFSSGFVPRWSSSLRRSTWSVATAISPGRRWSRGWWAAQRCPCQVAAASDIPAIFIYIYIYNTWILVGYQLITILYIYIYIL